MKDMKKVNSQSLQLVAISLLFLASTNAVATSCLDVFPSVLSSSSNNGKVEFKQQVDVIGTDGTLDIEVKKDDTSTDNPSCISQKCIDSNNRAEAFSLPTFQSSSSTQNETVNSGNSSNLPQGSYDKITLNYQATVRFTQSGEVTFINELKANSETTIIFEEGVYWIEKFEVAYQTNIIINGNDKVTILIGGKSKFDSSDVSINVNGTPDQLVLIAYDKIKFGYKAGFKGFVYGDKKIELAIENVFEGAINGDDIKLKFQAAITYAPASIESANFNGLCTASPTSGLSGNLAVDNTFEAYISMDDDVQGDFLSSGNNWEVTYTLLSQLTPGQDYYLHIKATNTGGPAGFLGDFEITDTEHTFSNGLTTLKTNTTDWAVSTSGWNNYQTPTSYGMNGSAPWSARDNIDASAEWIWSSNNEADNETYFSTHITVPPITPLIDYRFDECSYNGMSGDVIDQTGNLNGTSNGISAAIADSVINKSLDLRADNTNDWVDVPSDIVDGLDEFSVAVWLKTSTTKPQQEILHALGENTNDDQLEIFLKGSNVVYVKVGGNSDELTSSIPLTDGDWHHLVLTRVAQKICLFIDGIEQPCGNGVSAETLSVTSDNAVVIGQEQDDFGGSFDVAQNFVGQLDEFKIFDEKLSFTRISTIYQNEVDGNNFDASERDAVQCENICGLNPGKLNAVGIEIDNRGTNPKINTTTDALNIHADWLNAGSPAIGLIGNGAYYVAASGSSMVERIDFGGEAHDFSGTLSYPGASAGVGDTDFLVHTSGTLSLPAGDYTIYVESDDGFSFMMNTRSGDAVSFNKFGASNSGASNELRFETPTSNSNTGGSFTLTEDSVFDIAAIFYERGGGDYLEISIANEIRTNVAPSGYEILRDGAINGAVTFGACPAPTALVEYRFEELVWDRSPGEILDNTGNGYNAQVISNSLPETASPALTGNPGTCGYASQNDGSIQVTGLPLDTSSDGVKTTVTFWMNWDGTENVMPIGWDFHDIWFVDGNMGFNTFNGDIYGISSAGLENGWHHVAVEFTNGNVTSNRMYIDGIEQVLTQRLGSPNNTNAFVNSEMRIGGVANSSSYNFHGLLDEFRVYEKALTTAEVQTIMAETHTCPVPVVHHYEIVHDGQGLTCDPESVDIKACADASCSTLITQSVTLDFLADGAVISSPTFAGSTTITFNNTDVETLTFSLANTSITAANPLVCDDGSGTSCDMAFTNAGFRFLSGSANSSTLPNEISGSVFSDTLKIQAVKDTSGVCTGLFIGEKTINLSQENIQPGGVSGLSFATGADSILKHPNDTAITLDFGSNSIATIPTPIYNDAGQIRLRASYEQGGLTLLSGSSNAFWVSPAELVVSAVSDLTNLNGYTATAFTPTHAAGQDFSLSVTAVNSLGVTTPNYSPGQIQLMLTRTGPTSTDSVDGNLSYATSSVLTSTTSPSFVDVTLSNFSSGVSTYNAAQYSEVGLINLDVRDNNYGNINMPISAAAINIGRFIPAYFEQTVVEDGRFSATCNTSTTFLAYSGQMDEATNSIGAISYFSNPILAITAYNSQGNITQNYFEDSQGSINDYMKLSASDIKLTLPTIDQSAVDVNSNPLTVSATMGNGNLSQTDLRASSGEVELPRGTLHYRLSNVDRFYYQRSANALVAPFTSDIDFAIATITDTDSVSVSTSVTGTKAASPIGVEIRFARLTLKNSFGPETSNFPQLMEIEHFDGANFVDSLDENCASYDAGLISLTDISLNPALTSVLGGTEIFVNGKTQAIELQAPGSGNQGQIGVLYDAYDWFNYDWNGDGFYNNNPEAVATFGIYRGNDRTIHWREIFND